MDVTVAQLEALLAVGEHGSFTRAGQVLGRTQSAVSRAVAALESALGGPVVHRGAAGFTELGRAVAEHASSVLDGLRAINDLAADVRAPKLRVGAVASALVRFVPMGVRRLQRDWPQAQVLALQGEDDELVAWLADGIIDLAVTTQPGPDCQRTIDDEFLAVVPKEHPASRQETIRLAELIRLGVADPGGTCGPALAEGFAAHGVEWRPDHVVRDVGTVVAMASAGITAGVAPAMALPDPPPAAVAVRSLEPRLSRAVYLHYRPADPDVAHVVERLTTW
ncbi:LysR family transcriptional regulator [Amycolatopsis dendrobii]|uniref:LysR family transcriptional regulator n=1 Tax=Amycolatopsis dendrobii TaxID=2760662 RepID=A0A7W3W0N2_9PSEU|nr:LysR family transcriptional regulator [Amycolatopsis dendrobii]MBB1156620.1 LysR family transcriptional regulator [Amycolatopsis dendrobii]